MRNNLTIAALVLCLFAVLLPACNQAAAPPAPGLSLGIAVGGDDAANAAESEAIRATQRRMRQVLPKLDLTGISFNDALNMLCEVGTLNMQINWGAIQAAGIDRNTPVNVKLKDVTIEKALRTILDDVGGVNPLGYIIDEDYITISTRDDLAKITSVRIYDVGDLLDTVRPSAEDLALMRLAVREALNQPIPKDSAIGMATPPTLAEAYGKNLEDLMTAVGQNWRREAVESLMTAIRESVDRNSWIENSGTIGSMRQFGNRLIITASGENHHRISGLLQALRLAGQPPAARSARQAPPPSPVRLEPTTAPTTRPVNRP